MLTLTPTSQPGSHWHCPVTGWQPFLLFWHRHSEVQLEPWVPGRQGTSHSAPRHPLSQVHWPDTVSQLTLFLHLHVSLHPRP